jgi:hypothetical protein
MASTKATGPGIAVDQRATIIQDRDVSRLVAFGKTIPVQRLPKSMMASAGLEFGSEEFESRNVDNSSLELFCFESRIEIAAPPDKS